jgi:hypothetical protein
MRYDEFLNKVGICEQMVALANHYATLIKPTLSESNEKQVYNTFITNVKSNLTSIPIVNEQYCPIGLTVISPAKMILIKKIDHLVTFVKYHSKTKQFHFKDTEGNIHSFPAASNETHNIGESHQLDTLLFQSVNDSEQFLSMFLLTFSDWHIRYF